MEWAAENINRHGGIGGRPVELVYRDTSQGDTAPLARELLADDTVRIVIGPPTSDEVYLLAPDFEKKEKLLISPLTTSGDLIRAFGKKGYFWRTAQGDAAQVKVILSTLRSKNAQRISLLAENTTYGKTFWDWTGFFATESGIEVVSIRQYGEGSSTLEDAVEEALAGDPEYIILAGQSADAASVKQAIDRSNKPVRLFLTDAGATPELIRLLGSDAEGIEGVSPTADPSTGFAVAYRERFGHAPADYAAPAYDAVLLAAYATARQDASFYEPPADSMRRVVAAGSRRPAGMRRACARRSRRSGPAAIRTSPVPAGRSTSIRSTHRPARDVLQPLDGRGRDVPDQCHRRIGKSRYTGRSAGLSRASAALMTIAEGESSSLPAALVPGLRQWLSGARGAGTITGTSPTPSRYTPCSAGTGSQTTKSS
jgi:ABC-type branched-subunit amino acid transport system substrate-binding protein